VARLAPAPAAHGDEETLVREIEAGLEQVPSLDDDRILRQFLAAIRATTRTNAFQPGADARPKPYLSLKFDPRQVPGLPEPRPMFEIFVYSPRVEGVHLRGGPVARGGIRWSDRREDFRTEVLGLMKAQMVKNAVIVPVGSKGGFVVKQPPAAGDREALDLLFARYGPELHRFARGRLPRWARDLADTPDLVQEVLLRTFMQMGGFENRGEGALRAYMRQALMNRIRDEIRRTGRMPASGGLDQDQPDPGASPLEEAIGVEAVERYEAALARLRPEEREAIVAKIEMDGSYETVAQALGKRTPDAARMAVGRALLRLAEEMSRGA